MNMRNRVLGLVSALALSAVGAAQALAAEVTLKLHQFLPAQANVPKLVLDVWADKVEKDSNGRIKIERYPSMQLGGKPPELINQVQEGIADIVWTVSGYTPGRFPSTEVFELPFMMTNAEATSRAYYELYEKRLKNGEFKDFKVLGVWVHGPGMIHSKTPITKPSDLNGVKLRAPTRTTTMQFKGFGASPIGMPVPSVPENLSKGVIDATIIPWEVTAALKIAELVKNHTEFGKESLYTTTFIFAMNKAKYESLPADLKKVIDDNSGMEFSAFAGKTQAAADGPAREIAVKAGNNIITLTDEQVAEWKKASEPVFQAWIDEMKAKGIDGQELINEARALIAKYTK